MTELLTYTLLDLLLSDAINCWRRNPNPYTEKKAARLVYTYKKRREKANEIWYSGMPVSNTAYYGFRLFQDWQPPKNDDRRPRHVKR